VQDAIAAIDDVAFSGNEDILTRRQEDFLASPAYWRTKELQVDGGGGGGVGGATGPATPDSDGPVRSAMNPAIKMFLAVPEYLICSSGAINEIKSWIEPWL